MFARGVYSASHLLANLFDMLAAELWLEVQSLAPHAPAGRLGDQALNARMFALHADLIEDANPVGDDHLKLIL
jgi:hypothetical protein